VYNHQMLAFLLLYNLADNAVFVFISPGSPSALGFPLILFAEMQTRRPSECMRIGKELDPFLNIEVAWRILKGLFLRPSLTLPKL